MCRFNRTPQHDSALISGIYMTSIATRGPPTPIYIVNVHSKCYIFLRSEAKSLLLYVFKKGDRKDLKSASLLDMMGISRDSRLRTCTGTGCLHRNTHLVTGSIFSCVLYHLSQVRSFKPDSLTLLFTYLLFLWSSKSVFCCIFLDFYFKMRGISPPPRCESRQGQ